MDNNREDPNREFMSRDYIRGDKRLEAALAIAEIAHAKTKRWDGRPGITHPVLVARLLDAFDREDFLNAMELPKDGRLDENTRTQLAPLLKAVGHADAAVIDEEVYGQIAVFLKSVALLHDAVEDYKPYRDNPLHLPQELSAKLTEKQAFDTEMAQDAWVSHIYDCVRQMSNGKYRYEGKNTWETGQSLSSANAVVADILRSDEMEEGKRTWQVEHVKEMAPYVRPVKQLDQGGTTSDDIRYTDLSHLKDAKNKNDPDALKALAELRKKKGFAKKGLDVSRACRGENHRNPYHQFVKSAADYLKDSIRLFKAGDFDGYEMRREIYDLAGEIRTAQEASRNPEMRKPMRQESVVSYIDPHMNERESGVIRITLSKEEPNRVVSYAAIVAPKKTVGAKANAVAADFRQSFEGGNRHVGTNGMLKEEAFTLKEQGLEQRRNAPSARDYTINPPIHLTRFIKHARVGNAISDTFAQAMEGVARENERQKRALAIKQRSRLLLARERGETPSPGGAGPSL